MYLLVGDRHGKNFGREFLDKNINQLLDALYHMNNNKDLIDSVNLCIIKILKTELKKRHER